MKVLIEIIKPALIETPNIKTAKKFLKQLKKNFSPAGFEIKAYEVKK